MTLLSPLMLLQPEMPKIPVSWGHVPQGLTGRGDILVTMHLPGFLHAQGNDAALLSLPTMIRLHPSPSFVSSHLHPTITTFTFCFSNFFFPNR